MASGRESSPHSPGTCMLDAPGGNHHHKPCLKTTGIRWKDRPKRCGPSGLHLLDMAAQLRAGHLEPAAPCRARDRALRKTAPVNDRSSGTSAITWPRNETTARPDADETILSGALDCAESDGDYQTSRRRLARSRVHEVRRHPRPLRPGHGTRSAAHILTDQRGIHLVRPILRLGYFR